MEPVNTAAAALAKTMRLVAATGVGLAALVILQADRRPCLGLRTVISANLFE